MKNIFLTLGIFLITASAAVAGENLADLWAKGNKLYQQKAYDSAAVCFEKIVALKPKNVEAYYNLGNAYYRMNKVGPAILNYRRALHVDPGYNLAKDNLILAQNRMTNHVAEAKDIFFVDWWHSITAAGLATLWAILAFIIFSAMMLTIFLKGISKIPIKVPTQVPVFLGIAWLCLLVLAFYSARNANESGLAVVMQNDAPLLGEELKGKPLSLLPEGTTVKVKKMQGEYYEVVIPDGRKGYILQTWLTKV